MTVIELEKSLCRGMAEHKQGAGPAKVTVGREREQVVIDIDGYNIRASVAEAELLVAAIHKEIALVRR